jgi:hypothetical protein
VRPAGSRLAVCAGLLLILAGPAAAQTARPHKRPSPPPPSQGASDADNTVGDVAPPPLPGAGPKDQPARATATLRPAIPAPTLRSAVQSRWSQPATIARSTAGQCREQCALQRQSCSGGQGDTSGCDPGWTQCLSACAGVSYRRGP